MTSDLERLKLAALTSWPQGLPIKLEEFLLNLFHDQLLKKIWLSKLGLELVTPGLQSDCYWLHIATGTTLRIMDFRRVVTVVVNPYGDFRAWFKAMWSNLWPLVKQLVLRLTSETDVVIHDKMKKRTISNAYQIPPTGQWRKLISRIQRLYKMAKLFN